jgi:hypothetical protein
VLSLLAAAASLVPAESRAARRAAAAARLEARETAEPPNPAAETGRRVAS